MNLQQFIAETIVQISKGIQTSTGNPELPSQATPENTVRKPIKQRLKIAAGEA